MHRQPESGGLASCHLIHRANEHDLAIRVREIERPVLRFGCAEHEVGLAEFADRERDAIGADDLQVPLALLFVPGAVLVCALGADTDACPQGFEGRDAGVVRLDEFLGARRGGKLVDIDLAGA